ncbi:hypothetical protein MGYG_08299 [Nannizzia gypsea CBS 118893]|uniref:Uncharacterized protein n=1 Tax=Arthroderma gypseum (strain ATCC MYA-4604 / CBS 118893) TaxID=535722 RepID=E4V6A5_ARTGP|nr:hypothetical protein MGYG_08299 [Nannizzia gypsea CBS 118893]EFR05288.1 hypothetical protein MGYG_08299 [Nannizzia gypsea CBS 118893]
MTAGPCPCTSSQRASVKVEGCVSVSQQQASPLHPADGVDGRISTMELLRTLYVCWDCYANNLHREAECTTASGAKVWF